LQQPRRSFWLVISCLLFGGAVLAPGQDIIGAGYASPLPIVVAPGQVTTLFVHGLDVPSATVEAGQPPLPTTLAGITVTLAYQNSSDTALVPLFRVEPIGQNVVGLTLQMPFDLKIPVMTMAPPTKTPLPQPMLIVAQGRKRGQPFNLGVLPSNVHVVNVCDSMPKQPQYVYRRDQPCLSDVVAHGDGAPISLETPLIEGQTALVEAVGLGNTNAGVRAGEATPNDAPLTEFAELFRVCFEFLGAKQSVSPPCEQPEFVGLAPGQVGIYHIRAVMPDLPPDALSCGVVTGSSVNNVTMTIQAPYSRDQAHLCVQRRTDDPGTTIESPTVPGLKFTVPTRSRTGGQGENR